MKKCIVAFAAHTADAELGAGGTIAKLVRQGYRALVVVATTSVSEPVRSSSPSGCSPGEGVPTPCELAALREREARAAAQVLGHDLVFLRLNERFFSHEGTTQCVDFRERPPAAVLPGTGWF